MSQKILKMEDLIEQTFIKGLRDAGIEEKLVDVYSIVYANIYMNHIHEITLYCIDYAYFSERQANDPNYDMLDYNDFSFSKHEKMMSSFPPIPNTDPNIFSILSDLSEIKEIKEYVNSHPDKHGRKYSVTVTDSDNELTGDGVY